MATIYNDILTARAEEKKLLAVLIDPEKTPPSQIARIATAIRSSPATHIFVGGSTFEGQMEPLVSELRKIGLPVIIFPGHPSQISPLADALLLLFLASGRNPDYLIGHHVQAAPKLKDANIQILPTGYILVDGGNGSAVARVTGTTPIHDSTTIVNSAMACEMLGQKLIYLEAGSGALQPVESEIIRRVCSAVSIPVIVGGGIRSMQAIQSAYDAGAQMVVIGTAFEQNPEFFNHA